MKATLLIIAVTFLNSQVESLTRVTLYDHSNYGGSSSLLSDLDTVSYYYLTNFNDRTTSFKINYGSCVEMHMNNPPNYNAGWFWTTEINFSNVGSQYNDRISSVKGCGTRSVTITCPSGTFVKKMEWDSSTSLKQGVQIRCYLPGSLTPSASYRTHGSSGLGGSKECTGIRGVSYGWDERRQADVGLVPVCGRESSGPHKIMCEGNDAVSGIRVSIENRSGYIKTSALFCRDVGDIEEICRAHDNQIMLFECDASEALYPLKCAYSKKVGYGRKSSMSQTETLEYNFYSEYGFEMGAAGYGLSSNFKATLGTSNTTGYSWTTTQETTWNVETTISVEAEAPASCITRVYEIVGECSFIAVRPSVFKRNDTCGSTSILTNVYIPQDFDRSKVFHSPVPREVLRFLSFQKTGSINFIDDSPVAIELGDNHIQGTDLEFQPEYFVPEKFSPTLQRK